MTINIDIRLRAYVRMTLMFITIEMRFLMVRSTEISLLYSYLWMFLFNELIMSFLRKKVKLFESLGLLLKGFMKAIIIASLALSTNY